MKEYHAKLSYLRHPPQKVRELAGQIRGKTVPEAVRILSFSPRRAAAQIKKLMVSALSNGGADTVNFAPNIFVQSVCVQEGPVLKRWQPRARGRATPINHRTSHVYLSLKEKVF